MECGVNKMKFRAQAVSIPGVIWDRSRQIFAPSLDAVMDWANTQVKDEEVSQVKLYVMAEVHIGTVCGKTAGKPGPV